MQVAVEFLPRQVHHRTMDRAFVLRGGMNSEVWLCPELVFDGQALLTQTAVRVVNGVITALEPASHAPAEAKHIKGIVSPGFVDLQVNGGGGVLFNAMPSVQGIAQILEAHREFGTTGLLPTVITDRPEVLATAVEAVLDASDHSGVLGIHIEGPHISVPRRGTHSKEYIRPMDAVTLAQVERLRARDIPVIITVAPEAVSCEQIRQLCDMGAVVSLGHTDATAEATYAAIEAGARAATHLFNAMSPMQGRAPGVTGAVINSDIAAGLIVDGKHVADEMIALAIRARPTGDRTFIVSDAMPTVGGPNHFTLYGSEVRLDSGQLINAEGNLAGAHFTQAEGVFRLVNEIGVDRAAALRMAITIPAGLIGRPDLGTLVGSRVSDTITLSENMTFTGFL